MGFYRDRLPSLHNYEKATEEQKIWDIRSKIEQDLWKERQRISAQAQEDRDRQTRWANEAAAERAADAAEEERGYKRSAFEEERTYQREQTERTEQRERKAFEESMGVYKDTSAPTPSTAPTRAPYIAPGIGDRIDKIENDYGLEKSTGSGGRQLSSPSVYGSQPPRGGGAGSYGLPTSAWR